MLMGLEKKPFPEIIKGPRITLVLRTAEHAHQVWNYIERDHRLGGSNYVWVTSEEDVAKYITAEDRQDPNEITYLIMKNETAIGSFHVHTINYPDYKAELGYSLEKGEEGHGYVTEALKLAEGELRVLGFNKLVIQCNSNNHRSVQVAKRGGFKLEGTLLHDSVENGQFRDSAVFGKLLTDQF